jgi:hypothetical protein
MKTLITSAIFMFVVFSCVGQVSDSVLSYYNKIAFYSEFDSVKYDVPKKWKNNIVIYINVDKNEIKKSSWNEILTREVIKISHEINNLSNTIKLSVTNDSAKANLFIYIGSSEHILKAQPNIFSRIFDEGVGGATVVSNSSEIIRGFNYIDYSRIANITTAKHIVREELTQSLGLLNDTWDYEDSIFYEGWTRTQKYSDLDIEIIKLHLK